MERYSERNEFLSELHYLKNQLLGQLAEVNMAIQREEHAFDAKKQKTVTQQTKELLHRAQQPRPLWSEKQYQERAFTDEDPTRPPYDVFLQ